MESSAPTDAFDSAGEQPTVGSTPEGVATRIATTETHLAPRSAVRERCPACGATLASDQRYCVECGQRCGEPRLPFMDGVVQRAQRAPSVQPSSGRPRMSVNSTLIAGIGTLLLAMGIGVLIGRSGNGSSAKVASPPVQVVTVSGAGAATTSSTESKTATGATGTTKSTGTTSSSSATKSTSQASKKAAAVPPAKVVKTGSPGSGPGYEKGHFTGNFFGK